MVVIMTEDLASEFSLRPLKLYYSDLGLGVAYIDEAYYFLGPFHIEKCAIVVPGVVIGDSCALVKQLDIR